MNNEVDRKDLKIEALLQKISTLTTQYENQYADLRVEYTLLENAYTELSQQQNNPESVDEVPQDEAPETDESD